MGWTLNFNRSVRIEARRERITGDSGAVTGREVLRRAGVVRWMAGRLEDARDPRWIRHPLADLLRAALVLVAQGRRDHNDATAFGDDPALRLAVSGRSGTAPLSEGWGLASQPTLPRLVATLSEERRVQALREGLARFAGWWLRAMERTAAETPGHRRGQPAREGARRTAGQRVERSLPRPDLPSPGGVGGRDGGHPRRAPPQRPGGHGRRRPGVHRRDPGPGRGDAVRRGDCPLRHRIPRGGGADVGTRGPGHALRRPGAQQRGARSAGPAGDARECEALAGRVPGDARRGRGPANWTSRTGPGPGRAHAGSSRCWSNGPANCSRARSGC